jgi:hypothetical protein
MVLISKKLFRLCLDASRGINLFVDYDTTVLDNIQTVIPRVEEGSFFMTWDLCSMYHQLSLFLNFKIYKMIESTHLKF